MHLTEALRENGWAEEPEELTKLLDLLVRIDSMIAAAKDGAMPLGLQKAEVEAYVLAKRLMNLTHLPARKDLFEVLSNQLLQHIRSIRTTRAPADGRGPGSEAPEVMPEG